MGFPCRGRGIRTHFSLRKRNGFGLPKRRGRCTPFEKGTKGRCTPFLFPRGKRNAVPAKRKTARGVPIPPLHPPQTAKRGHRPPFGISPAACGPGQDGSCAEGLSGWVAGGGCLSGRHRRAFPGIPPAALRAGPFARAGARAHSASPVRRGRNEPLRGWGTVHPDTGGKGTVPQGETGGILPPESFPPFVIRQRGPSEPVPRRDAGEGEPGPHSTKGAPVGRPFPRGKMGNRGPHSTKGGVGDRPPAGTPMGKRGAGATFNKKGAPVVNPPAGAFVGKQGPPWKNGHMDSD